ncbi:MAG: glycosyltransferase family 4 protein [Pirellulaceae bacterium]
MVLHTRVVSGTGGGPEKTILNSPRYLIPFGYNSICAYMHPPQDAGFDELTGKARQLDAPLVGVEDRGPLDLRVVKRMLDLCQRERVAIWHGHDYKSNALGLLLRPFWPMKLVTTVHGWGVQQRRTSLYYGIDRFCMRWYDRVICVSDDLRTRCIESRVPEQRCVLIENAIDTTQYSRCSSTDEAKRRLSFHSGRLLIGAVGRLSEEKNFDGLIRAADRLLNQGLDLELIIVGDGDQRRRLELLIAELGREDRFCLLGFRSDTIDLYQAMDVFVLTSLREGLPNVLLEAMALKVPVLATRIAGVPKLVQHEQNGLLIEPGDTDQITAGLRRLLSDATLRQQLATAARHTIETSYSFDVRMAKVRKIYDEVLGRSCQLSVVS